MFFLVCEQKRSQKTMKKEKRERNNLFTSESREVDRKVDPDGDAPVLPEQLLGPRGVGRHRGS